MLLLGVQPGTLFGYCGFQLEVIEGQGGAGRGGTAHPAGKKSAPLHGKHIIDSRKEALVLGQVHALIQATLQLYTSLNWQSGGRPQLLLGAFC